MLAIEVEYLLGRAVATDPSQRDLAEWPPHPTRLYSALVDALHDVSDQGRRAECEAALRWMECEPPPEIKLDPNSLERSSRRAVVKHFVPINDETADPKNMRAAPIAEVRTRQERYFPAVVPGDPRVVFAWPDSAPTDEQLDALSDLAARVPYLGHSSSLVRVRCTREKVVPVLRPRAAGEFLLRVPGKGRLDRLQMVHDVRKANAYVQPPRGREVWYAAEASDLATRGPYAGMRVIAFDGDRFGLAETARVTGRFRAALLSKLPSGVGTPEVLSGHDSDGRPSARPHVAFVPLANIALRPGNYADGTIKGIGVCIPIDATEEAIGLLDDALTRLASLVFGPRGQIDLRVVAVGNDTAGTGGPTELRSLQPERYMRPATTFRSVTPIALGLHPRPNKGLTREAIVVKHLHELGLPAIAALSLQEVSSVYGADPASAFHRGDLKSIQGRILCHAVLEFTAPIRGPLVVGAGRYMGFGLLLPSEATS